MVCKMASPPPPPPLPKGVGGVGVCANYEPDAPVTLFEHYSWMDGCNIELEDSMEMVSPVEN